MTNTPTTIVIFGASGDLARRKLIPALYRQWRKGRLPEQFKVVGFSYSDWSDDYFRGQMVDGLREFASAVYEEETCADFCGRLHYVQGSFTDSADFSKLNKAITAVEPAPSNRLYYLAAPPRFFLGLAQEIHGQGMMAEKDGLWRRLIIEKPFGNDLASAQQLNAELHTIISEHQIYRIDHYLAKETVQNLLVFRFANAIFEPLWNRNYIDHIQITAAESVDVGHRAGYYDHAGVLRDMFQNHLMQLMALVGMEPPASFEADAVRDEKVKLLKAVRPISAENLASRTVRAQYEGYLDAPDVAEGSTTPTYAALELHIDNWRWRGVPFYLRSGKGLKKKTTEIIIQFKEAPHNMFPGGNSFEIRRNYLALCIQPHEAIHLRFETKVPDTEIGMQSVDMAFDYDDHFGEDAFPEAYERLLLEAIQGDATLFTRSDGIESAWHIIDPIIKGWESDHAPEVDAYPIGSWGPTSADLLLSKFGAHWQHACAEH